MGSATVIRAQHTSSTTSAMPVLMSLLLSFGLAIELGHEWTRRYCVALDQLARVNYTIRMAFRNAVIYIASKTDSSTPALLWCFTYSQSSENVTLECGESENQ